MTTIETGAEALPLDRATFNTMVSTTLDALPHPPGSTAEQRAEKREAALLAVAALHPRDPLEAMEAACIVALHYHAMHDLACSIQPNVPGPLQLRCEARAQSLARQSVKLRTDYLKRQEVEPARRPAGLPASVPPERQVQPQPAPQAAATEVRAASPTADAAPQPAPATRPDDAAPAARPVVAPVSASRGGEAVAAGAPEQVDAEADDCAQAPAMARAA